MCVCVCVLANVFDILGSCSLSVCGYAGLGIWGLKAGELGTRVHALVLCIVPEDSFTRVRHNLEATSVYLSICLPLWFRKA